ncbi:hypothetical protein [Haloplanus sp. C73]|uniref:hypothetical protein n=1 Tax=Haloplanus sp. C73 TaxID=3421641 RepID=UPI003EBF76F4
MDRRALLAATGTALAGLAGCGADGSSETPTATTEPTRTPTATATAQPTLSPPDQNYRPQLLDVALVSTWSEAGDLEANRTEQVRRGQPAVIAFRYRIRIPEGTVNLKEGIDIIHDGELVVRENTEVDRYVDSAGLHTWETAMTLETGDWPTGEVTASVAIGELQLHRTSNTVATRFEVTAE